MADQPRDVAIAQNPNVSQPTKLLMGKSARTSDAALKVLITSPDVDVSFAAFFTALGRIDAGAENAAARDQQRDQLIQWTIDHCRNDFVRRMALDTPPFQQVEPVQSSAEIQS